MPYVHSIVAGESIFSRAGAISKDCKDIGAFLFRKGLVYIIYDSTNQTHPAGKILLYPNSMTKTRTVYYVLHCTPDRPYPLHSGAPFPTLERARLECRKLVKQGYSGWILRLREVRQEAWPKDQWLIDHSVDDAIGWMEPF